jgi:SRSO17 transposase
MRTVHIAQMRAKDEVRLDQYEVRLWDAWHRHVTLCMLAHAASQVARAREGP